MQRSKPAFAARAVPESTSKASSRAPRRPSGTTHNPALLRSPKKQTAPQRKSARNPEMCIDETGGYPKPHARPETQHSESPRNQVNQNQGEIVLGCPLDCQEGLSLSALGGLSLHFRVDDLISGKTDPYLIMRGRIPVKSIHDL